MAQFHSAINDQKPTRFVLTELVLIKRFIVELNRLIYSLQIFLPVISQAIEQNWCHGCSGLEIKV